MKYFSFNEFERSETAYRHGIDNRMPESARERVAALVDNVLDPLREAWGKPITVTSGYRCPALNRAVGGAATSQHLKGEAADITTGNYVDNARLFQMILDRGLQFDQLIFERGSVKTGPAWIHISYKPDGHNRRQIIYNT